MFDSLNHLVGAAKDKVLQTSLKALLNRKLEAYGEITNLEIGSSQGRVTCELLLKGETGPLSLQVDRYELIKREGKVFLRILEARASREWITRLLQDFIVNRQFELPEAAALAL